ncbi:MULTISPECIES: NADP-dependent oxidoreductase [unclassified Streptomyces]|uniref:NADP-dependent oxidoreductase n=1 Tax=unclassified Streptomyces TaxID=2593676 RepID=UPI002DD8C79B|nr:MULTISPECIES: NADP-dependent oxidoreductase [unclassified Streptomyces]WSF85569.1 NADP-dependent oxidoreductase [Streptomyces sp. NBC_01744]WSC46265.1 NADP-dependent oxidoreductase [Streptomyces sp. NBC_01762]WSC54732.1 NADP-dependent oxidoreductase [Streptomyces sp. NBC_01761]WSD25919.1 NADP-dependent oxidoreductase [Streptomyces sp. NBC_01751]WSJ52119.1 NADP-dependent oxidoreductase [Streptomyces sp. NBC_01318]
MRAVAVSAFRAEPTLVEVPKPIPAAGDVRVRIEYAALNPSDWQTADGALEGQAPHVFPLVIGVDYAGRVDMIGTGDNRFRVGDAVFGRVTGSPVGTGTYCEYVSVPQDSAIALVPDGLPLRIAAALPTAGMTAAQILETAVLRGHESLLVIGAAGGVGSCLTQLASARDLRVLAVVRGDEGWRMGALGAAVTLDTTARPLEEAVREVSPGGVDALVDLVSTTPEAFAAMAALVRSGGAAVTTRGVAGRATVPEGVGSIDFRLEPTPVLLDVLAAGAAEGVLKVLVDIELPLEKAPQALDRNRTGGARGKTLFAL